MGGFSRDHPPIVHHAYLLPAGDEDHAEVIDDGAAAELPGEVFGFAHLSTPSQGGVSRMIMDALQYLSRKQAHLQVHVDVQPGEVAARVDHLERGVHVGGWYM